MKPSIVLATLAATLAPAAASAQTAFGDKGQITVSSTGGANLLSSGSGITTLTPFIALGSQSVSDPARVTGTTTVENTTKTTFFLLNPGIDVFVIDHLSIGGEVLLGKESFSSETKTTTGGVVTTRTTDSSALLFGFMPRVGYDIPLDTHFSIWPRGGLGFVRSSGDDSSTSNWFLFADVPFVWHPNPHFVVGVGPGVTLTLSHSTKVADVSTDRDKPFTFRFLSFMIGGVLN